MKITRIILLLVLVLFAGTAAAENTAILGQPFPDFTAEDTEGNTFALSEALKDHEAVLVNIWATWCSPCRQEFPDLNEVYEQYKDRVAFIALSSEPNDTLPVIADFRKEMELAFPMGREEGTGLASYLNVMGIPTTVIVDRFGNAVFMRTGAFAGAAEVGRLLDAFLGDTYTETRVLDSIPRDTTTRAFPVSAARALYVDNEDARRFVLRVQQAEAGYDMAFEGYVISGDTARLRFEIAADENPASIVYLGEGMKEMTSLLDPDQNTYVYEQRIPDGMHYTSGALINQDVENDGNAIQFLLIAGEEYIKELEEEFRSWGATVSWQYEDLKTEKTAAEAYILHMADQYGNPVPGVAANFCTDTACNMLVSDENGIISVSGEPTDYHVQLLKAPDGYSFDKGFEMQTGTAFGEWSLLIRKD